MGASIMGLYKAHYDMDAYSVYKRPAKLPRFAHSHWWNSYIPMNGRVMKRLAPSEIRVNGPTYQGYTVKWMSKFRKIAPSMVYVFGGFYILQQVILEQCHQLHYKHRD